MQLVWRLWDLGSVCLSTHAFSYSPFQTLTSSCSCPLPHPSVHALTSLLHLSVHAHQPFVHSSVPLRIRLSIHTVLLHVASLDFILVYAACREQLAV